ncbi:hypothetical protein [Spirulina sp. 06S082]|uniref:hypothetical protein n=1 Tax=Spirulina sp. 06S082 TaxID=3110248 RepID=UPI002B1F2B64|nr:hypothetical protein [Spirulina sp. 06S082]MEA5468720.1 hypothetical protein [Spirulina sp. 06S082]
MPTQEELVDSILKSLETLDRDEPATDKLATYCYTADKRLPNTLEKFAKHLKIKNPSQSQLKERGNLLEQIVYLVFQGLKGATSFKSFQSAGSQYDLLVTGDNEKWKTVCELLYLGFTQRGIITESKARKDKLQDKDFARLCSIMELNLTGCGLGIFFTLEGATGFPTTEKSNRQRKISDCKLRQVIFHAKTQKYIVVFDKDEILKLGENGTFITMLTRKIRDIRELSGIPPEPVENFQEIDLPAHLKEL